MGGQQQLVEQPRPEKLRREGRAPYPDRAVGLGPERRQSLDRVVAADDPGVVIRAVAGARDEHLGLGCPDPAVFANEVRRRCILGGPWPVLLHRLVVDPPVDDHRERLGAGVELAVQLFADAHPLPAPSSPGTCSIRRSRDTFIAYTKRPMVPLPDSACGLQSLY